MEIGGSNIAQISRLKIRDGAAVLRRTCRSTPGNERSPGSILQQVDARLGYLEAVGPGLPDARPHHADAQRRRSAARGADLRTRLQPGQHALRARRAVGRAAPPRRRPLDRARSKDCAIAATRSWWSSTRRPMLRGADQVIEIGPAAGERGGRSSFRARPRRCSSRRRASPATTWPGDCGVSAPSERRPPNHGWLAVAGARGNNLQNLTVEFPLGVLCLVTGCERIGQEHAGPGHALPALCRRKRKNGPKPLSVRRHLRRRADRRRGAGRPEPDRPLAAVQPGHLHQGVRPDPRGVCRRPSRPARTITRPATSVSTSTAAAAPPATATATSRSTCSSWPTST